MPHRKAYLVQLHPDHDPDLHEAIVKFIRIVLQTWHGTTGFEHVLDDINDNVIGRFHHLLGPPSPTNPIRSPSPPPSIPARPGVQPEIVLYPR